MQPDGLGTNARPLLRFVLIGAGANVAGLHLEALAATAGARLVGVCDTRPDAASRFASRGVPFYSAHRPMVDELRPDVAVVVTPHPSHADIAVELLCEGLHVLVEKPIASEVGDADRMIEAARDAGRVLAVALQERFAPIAERAREIVASGALGDLVRVSCSEPWFRTAAYFRAAGWRGTWRGEGGGVLLNQAPHTLDLLCHLVGPPARVWGVARTRRHAIECEDTAHALLEYANGATGYLAVSTAEAGGTRRLEIVGEAGRLDLEGDRLTLSRFEPSADRHVRECGDPFGAPAVHVEGPWTMPRTGSHLRVYEDLVRAIREGAAPRTDGAEARMSLELANAITLSSRSERPVDLPLDRDAYAALLYELREGGAPSVSSSSASRRPAR